jgi:hypothetical protein
MLTPSQYKDKNIDTVHPVINQVISDHFKRKFYFTSPIIKLQGENSCEFKQDAEMLLFDLDSEVKSFIELLKTGTNIKLDK